MAVLKDRLAVLHDLAYKNAKDSSTARKLWFDKGRSNRELTVRDLIMLRIPGLTACLDDSCEDPYKVEERLNSVNYKVTDTRNKKRVKTVHINNTKRYMNRDRVVNRVVVVTQGDVAHLRAFLGMVLQEVCA